MYLINFTGNGKKFSLTLHCNGANSYLFVNGKEIDKFKAKDSEIVATPLCLWKISKDWLVDNMKKKKKWIKWVRSDAIALHDILDIHNYLMKKEWHSVIKSLSLLKGVFLRDYYFHRL